MPRGSKQCPECKTVTGPRAFKCSKCNYDYHTKKAHYKSSSLIKTGDEVAAVNPLTQYASRDDITWPLDGIHYVFIPGRRTNDKKLQYPFKPKSIQEEDMVKWIRAMEGFTFDSGQGGIGKYCRSAVKYLVNEFFPRYPTGYLGAGQHPDYVRGIELVNKYMKPVAVELL